MFTRLRVLFRVLGMALTTLWAYKLRSVFVMLATALGIASLTVIIASVDGAQRMAVEITQMFGPDAAFILGGDIFNRAVGQRTLTLSWDDARRLQESLPGVYLVVPMRAKFSVIARVGNQNAEVPQIVGSTANYAESWDWPLASGRDLSQEDVDMAAKVAILGDTVSANLFGGASPLGKSVFVEGIPFTVVGTLSYRGISGGGGGDMNDRIVIPLSTLTKRFNMDRKYFRALRVKFHDADHMAENAENLRSFLRNLHGLAPGQPDDFTVLTAEEVLKFLSMLKGSLVIFLGVTAAVAILVGGFVLANLFYLSVSERAAEIGLKRAMGARSGAILIQFLSEAVALTVLGALVGLLLGLGMGEFLDRLGILDIQLSWKIFFVSMAAATAIGATFGLRPARRAARMDPIEALRS